MTVTIVSPLELCAAGKAEAIRSFVPAALPAAVGKLDSFNGSRAGGTIEIVLANGRRLVVGGDVDVGALTRVIEALEPR